MVCIACIGFCNTLLGQVLAIYPLLLGPSSAPDPRDKEDMDARYHQNKMKNAIKMFPADGNSNFFTKFLVDWRTNNGWLQKLQFSLSCLNQE